MAHSKYSDARRAREDDDDNSAPNAGGLSECKLHLLPPRKYDPSAGGDDGEGGIYSRLTEFSQGGQFWRPQFYRRDPGYTFIREEVQSLNDGWTHYESDERRAELEAQMPTYRPPRHPRACPSCRLTTCFGPDYHELADIQDFQQRARAVHRQAGDYNRHTHDYSIP